MFGNISGMSRQSQLVISLARLARLMVRYLRWGSCLNRSSELPGAGGRIKRIELKPVAGQ